MAEQLHELPLDEQVETLKRAYHSLCQLLRLIAQMHVALADAPDPITENLIRDELSSWLLSALNIVDGPGAPQSA